MVTLFVAASNTVGTWSIDRQTIVCVKSKWLLRSMASGTWSSQVLDWYGEPNDNFEEMVTLIDSKKESFDS